MDTRYVNYMADEFASCLQSIEFSIANCDSILERSNIYLGKLNTLHARMLLPPAVFDDLDAALGKLYACTFPAEEILMDHAAGHNKFDQQLFMACEKELIAVMHKNEYVCKAHECRLLERHLRHLVESSNVARSGAKQDIDAIVNSQQETTSNVEPSGSGGASTLQRQPVLDSTMNTVADRGKRLYCYACKSMTTFACDEPIKYRCPACNLGRLSKLPEPLASDCYM